MKQIKVCFVATYAWALFAEQLGYHKKTPFGGSEIQLYQLARRLARDKDFEVSFIVGDFGQKDALHCDGIKVYKGFKPPEYIIAHLKQFSIKWVLITPLRLWQVLHRVSADIYIQRAATWITGIIALFCKLFRKKFVYMVACEWDVSGEYENKNSLKGKLFGWGLRKAHLVFVQHPQQQTLLLKQYHKPSHILKSPLFPIEAEQEVAIKDTILWAGRADPLKRPELFLELARQLPQERFIMVCQPAVYYGTLFEQIRAQAQEIPNLSFIDYVPFTRIDQYFRKARILVNTSDYEGFPNTFIQAAKNKTPILSFKVNPDYFINRCQCGFCAEGNLVKMVEQLRELLNNKSLWCQMSENAHRYAQEHHNLHRVIPEFKKILKSLVLSRSL